MLSNTLWTEAERLNYALDMFYEDDRPEDDMEAFALMMCFLDATDPEDFQEVLEEEQKQAKTPERILDFHKDGNFIYTAFLRVYNIDILETPLHWWKFRTMLDDISETPAIQNLIRIRTMSIDDVPDTKKSELRRLKKQFAIDSKPHHTETLEERNSRWKGM